MTIPKSGAGRPPKYHDDFKRLRAHGDCVRFDASESALFRTIMASAYYYGRRHGFKTVTRRIDGALHIYRSDAEAAQ